MMIAEALSSQTRLGRIAIAVLLCLGIGLRVANLGIVTGRSPDETNYTRQANTLLQEGSAGLRRLAAEYQSDPAARIAGPPTRAGYLWLLAATMRLTGRNDERAGATLSCAASVGSLFVLTLIGIRFFPLWATLFALLSLAVSPAELELARRAWTDALAGLLGLTLIYVAGEITRDSERRVWHWLFVFIGSLGIVGKEFGPVVFGLCAVWVLWVMLIQRKEFRSGLAVMAGGLVGTAASVVWLAHSIGGFSVLAQTVTNWRAAHLANAYALEYQSGPGYFLLQAFYVISPVAALLCLIGLAVALLSHPKLGGLRVQTDDGNWQVSRWIALFLLVYLSLGMMLPRWLNLRYVSVLFGPYYLIAGLGFWYCATVCWKRLGKSLRPVFAAAIILGFVISASSDYRRFQRMFVRNGLGDLSVKLVLDRANMTAAEKRVKRAPTPENYLLLCHLYNLNWRYPDAIAACRNALALRPEDADAYADAAEGEIYDELAAAYVDLARWEEAIQAAQEALKRNPDLPRARDNLARAIDQKQLNGSAAASTP